MYIYRHIANTDVKTAFYHYYLSWNLFYLIRRGGGMQWWWRVYRFLLYILGKHNPWVLCTRYARDRTNNACRGRSRNPQIMEMTLGNRVTFAIIILRTNCIHLTCGIVLFLHFYAQVLRVLFPKWTFCSFVHTSFRWPFCRFPHLFQLRTHPFVYRISYSNRPRYIITTIL